MLKQIKAVCLAIMLTLGALAPQAHAALPDGVATTFTGISTDFASLLALFFPVFLLIVGGFITIKLLKRLANKL